MPMSVQHRPCIRLKSMSEDVLNMSGVQVSDKVLRDLAKNVAKILPNFAEKEPTTGVK